MNYHPFDTDFSCSQLTRAPLGSFKVGADEDVDVDDPLSVTEPESDEPVSEPESDVEPEVPSSELPVLVSVGPDVVVLVVDELSEDDEVVVDVVPVSSTPTAT